jgi:archaemetzincin
MRAVLAMSLAGSLCLGAEGMKPDANTLAGTVEKLRPLHAPMRKPGPDDWLANHWEAGQSFRQYLASDPVVLAAPRRTIYVQPLGAFGEAQNRIVTLSAEFVSRFYNTKVTVSPALPLSAVPASARRRHPSWGMEQVLAPYVLDDILKPRLPRDAAVSIAFTTSDLWPGPGWNFVFGQASLRERVGVWSLYRNGDPTESPAAFRLCLLRTLKTAVHEIGHMFSIQHCTAYECGMCGSNHREESDRRPLWFCPECQAKVCWATGVDPVTRYRRLAEFCRTNGLPAEATFYARSARALAAPGAESVTGAAAGGSP